MRTTIILFILFSFYLNTFAQKDPYLLQDIRNKEAVNSIDYSADGKKLVAGYSDGTASIIDVSSEKKEVDVEGHWKGILAVEIAPNNKFFITAGDNRVKVWSLNGDLIHTLKRHTTTIFTADIDAESKYLITGSASPVFKRWDLTTGEFLDDIPGHSERTSVVKYSRDGKIIASGSADHTIKIWDAMTLEELYTVPSHSEDIYALDFSPDGKMLASCSKDKTIRIYDLEKRELLKILTGHKNFVLDIEFAPDNLHLVSCSFDMEIRIWEIPTGKNMYSFIDHQGEITDICFAPDGKTFATASQDKTIKIWDYNPEIFVDFYYSDEVISEMEKHDEFLPKQKGEAKKDYEERMNKAATLKKEIYNKFFTKYLDELSHSKLPGMSDQ